MNKYLVTMYNEFGCDIASEVVEAEDEYDAVDNFIDEHNIIVYPGDTFEAVQYTY